MIEADEYWMIDSNLVTVDSITRVLFVITDCIPVIIEVICGSEFIARMARSCLCNECICITVRRNMATSSAQTLLEVTDFRAELSNMFDRTWKGILVKDDIAEISSTISLCDIMDLLFLEAWVSPSPIGTVSVASRWSIGGRGVCSIEVGLVVPHPDPI